MAQPPSPTNRKPVHQGYNTTKGYAEITDYSISTHQEESFGSVFGCIHLRRAVLIFTCLEFLWSLIAVFGMITDDCRIIVQGYTVHSKLFASVMGMICVILCYLYGVLGVYDASPDRLRTFLYGMMIKIFFMSGLFGHDIVILRTCKDIGIQNPILQRINAENDCQKHYDGYIVAFSFHMVFLLFGMWHTYRLMAFWSDGAIYRINFKRDPLFVSYRSFAESSDSGASLDL